MSLQNKIVFSGAATALVTPFLGGEIDFAAFEKLISRQLDGGIDALVVCGTTGEASCLSREERKALIRCAVSKAGGMVPVIAGTGSNRTETALTLTADACDAGADAVLVVTPYYNKATPDGLIRHFTAIADASEKSVLLYHVPGRCGIELTLPVLRVLSRHPNIAGIKDASGNMQKICQWTAELPTDDFKLYSGCDELTLPILSIGGEGVISVLSNLLPRETHHLTALFADRRNKEAAELSARFQPLLSALFREVNPVPVKAAMASLGWIREEYRLPLCSPSEETRLLLENAMEDSGFSF